MEKRFEFSRKFTKQYRKSDAKIKAAFDRSFKLMVKEPYSHRLNNHQLKGRYHGMRSINVTGDWRALFAERKKGKVLIIEFKYLGTHSELYR